MRAFVAVAAVLAAFLSSAAASTQARSPLRTWLKSCTVAAGLAAGLAVSPHVALADRPLNAPTAAGTRVNSDAESLLRYGLPINVKEIRDVQASVENIKGNLRTRRVNFAQGDASSAQRQLESNRDKILKQVPASRRAAAEAQYAKMLEDLDPLLKAINLESNAGSGSLQQRDALDGAYNMQDKLSKDLSAFEELLVPEGFKRDIPEEYSNLPALQGRAEVEMVFTRPSGEKFNVDGKNYDQVKISMVVDGYNAPLTGGNFVDLVNKGFYNKRVVTRSDGFVVQTGDSNPGAEGEGTVHGFVPSGATEVRTIPLELSFKGDKDLVFGSTSEEEGRGAAAATLPFQSYGALGMARGEFEPNSASSQFFWLLFESDLTPAGKNMLDGRYTCFGYTVDGADLLKAVREGDVISTAKVTKGAENLVPPKA